MAVEKAFIEISPGIFESSTSEKDKEDLCSCPYPEIEEAQREICRLLNNQQYIYLEEAFEELLQGMITTIKRLLQKYLGGE